MAIIDGGKIVALDTPDNLLKRIDDERGVVFDHQPQLELAHLRALPSVARVVQESGTVQVFGSAENLVSSVVLLLEEQKIPIHNLRTVQPDLEDVFIALTGKALRE